MAKLGNCIARFMKEKYLENDDLILYEKTEYAINTQNKILKKRTVRFLPDEYNPKGKLHSYGWKLYGKAKINNDIYNYVAKMQKALEREGFKRVK